MQTTTLMIFDREYYGRLMCGLVLVGWAITVLGCGSSNHLAEYDFKDRTVAVVTATPPAPEVLTGDYFHDSEGPWWRTFLTVGTEIAEEVEAAKARKRLDQAAREVNVADRFSERIEERSMIYLGSRAVEEPTDADFVLDVRVEEYGIRASSWTSDTHFNIEAEMTLVDRATGRTVWKRGVDEESPITRSIFGLEREADNIITAQALARLSVEEMRVALEHLATYAADEMVRKLRGDWDDACS